MVEKGSPSSRVHITIVVPTDVRTRAGGIATFVRSFIRHAPDDFVVALVSMTASDEEVGRWHSSEVGGRGIHFFPVGQISDANRRAAIPLAMRFAIEVLRHRTAIAQRSQNSILQFHRPASEIPGGFPGAAARVRILHTFSGQLLDASGDSRWRMMPSALEAVERWSVRRSSQLIAVNERAADEYRRRYPNHASRIHFVPNWVELDRFNPRTSVGLAHQARRALGLVPSERVIVVVGRLAKEKRPERALEAFASVASANKDAHLVYVGDGPLRGVVERRAARYGLTPRVHFVGVVDHDDVAKFFSMAELTLIASANETGPTSCLESLACGTPVVGTAVGQIPTWVEDGRNGFVVEHHADCLAEGVSRVLDGDRARFRAEAAASAKPFEARRVLRLVYQLHRQLVSNSCRDR